VSRVGADLVEAFEEMAAHLRGEVEVESYEVPANVLTPARIREIRRKVGPEHQGLRSRVSYFRSDHGILRAGPQKTGRCNDCSSSHYREGTAGRSAGTRLVRRLRLRAERHARRGACPNEKHVVVIGAGSSGLRSPGIWRRAERAWPPSRPRSVATPASFTWINATWGNTRVA
jgi:hypothetical protein